MNKKIVSHRLTDIQVLNLVLNSSQFLDMPSGIHGRKHACKVFVLANSISTLMHKEKNIDNTAIIISSLLHDCGRINDNADTLHSIASAKKAMLFIKKNNISCNRVLIKECIIRHCPPTSYSNIKPSIESKIVGDADKLDRFRFNKKTLPCNKSFLELKESHSLLDISARLNNHKWRSFI